MSFRLTVVVCRKVWAPLGNHISFVYTGAKSTHESIPRGKKKRRKSTRLNMLREQGSYLTECQHIFFSYCVVDSSVFPIVSMDSACLS